jgi:UDP-glucose:(heptosyl)LPS alpha-1,3-glucosyltransferase
MERQLTRLISDLLNADHEVTLVSRTCGLPPHPKLRWIRVPGPSRPFIFAYPWFALCGSLLVLLHGRGAVHSTGAIVLNRTSICTVHFCHHATADLKLSRASRNTLAYRLNGWIAPKISRLGERWCYRPRRTRRLVAVSAGIARELRKHFPRMAGRTLVIPNGVDTDEFHPAEDALSNRNSDNVTVLFVGGEWERKGLGIAIEAIKGLRNVTLLVIGNGPIDVYESLACRLGIADRIAFIGPRTDVAAWYRRADVFVLPTAYESFSLVTYEAAASGLPLLVTRVHGVEELLSHGENGWFIDRDPAAVRACLRKLQRDPKLRASMGDRARRDSLRFSWSGMARRYSELYREAANLEEV